MRHLIDPLDLSPEEITSLLDLADRIRSDPAAYQDVAAHKKLATLFYEPSTRTRLSFVVWVGCWWPPSPALMTGMRE